MAKDRLVIKHRWALGDTVLLTALIRDIHKEYPGRFEIKVNTNWSNVWWNNPYVTQFEDKGLPRALKVEVGWGDAIRWNAYAKYANEKRMTHILAWYHYDFSKKTGIKVPVTLPKPDLHLSAEENKRILQGRYWVVISGGKLDMTTKHWHAHRMQEVVNKLKSKGIHCVQVGATHVDHVHPTLDNATNMIGKTDNVRDLWNIIKYSDGVICGVTGAMHIAAAFDRPCVVYAGGREEPWFEAYTDKFKAFGDSAEPVVVEHKFLHTIGLLDCCDVQGCWKKRTVPLDPQDHQSRKKLLCRQPVRPADTHPVAKCQDLITSNHVVEAVMDYYDKNVLPPIELINDDSVETEAEIQIPVAELVTVVDGMAINKITVPAVKVLKQPSVAAKEQKAYQQVHPLEYGTATPAKVQRKLSVMDNPIIGGRITAFVLGYGPHTDIMKKCLTSITATIPEERLDLRVAVNEAPDATIQLLKQYPITKRYINRENKYKYPVMREMFWDEECPIETNYVLWFDDDTWVVQPNWIVDLCQTIIGNHGYGFRMYGNLMYHDLAMYKNQSTAALQWFKQADWYKQKPLRLRGSRQAATNGSIIDFAVGWCWAIETAAIRKANIPDVRLNHNGGDITIGEQIHQAGIALKQWNKGKKLVACPTREQGGRRGYSERFPWDPTK